VKIVRYAAALMALSGLLLLGLVGYKIWDPFAGARQTAAQQKLEQTWDGAPPAIAAAPAGTSGPARASQECVPSLNPSTGTYFAIIQIPALGKNWKFTVIQGTTLTQLSTGPGHIVGTPYPGQQGNVGIAAHDVTAGNPFLYLASLKPDDKIIVTTKDCVTTYQVNKPSFRVLYTDVAVLNPQGTAHTITLVTCWPTNVLYFVQHRTIVQGTEVSSVKR